ncbi:MAG: M2 family metallopeptidase [Candidatus Poribacteria bacterium]|nr:M2 family metallopeptidase [Candidatus Poribacteria bacterium]MDE0504345.1 M2 family metallopeptidase [Candidatus Poribacteria bacterium]
MESKIQRFVDDLTAVVEPLAGRLAEAYWEASITGSYEATQRVEQLETEYRLIFADHDRFEELKAFHAESQNVPSQLSRQLQLLLLEFTSEQLPSEAIKELVRQQTAIEQIFTTHRAVVGGVEMNDNAIRDVLKSEIDQKRRRIVWEASKQIGHRVAADLIKLARLRNESAQAVGFEDYYQMSLTLHEIDSEELLETVSQMEALTNEPYSKIKLKLDNNLARRFDIDVEALRPWHYSDVFFQEAPHVGEVNFDELFADIDIVEVAEVFFQGIKLPIDDLVENSDLYERGGKNQHAFCIHIDRLGDVRVLANIRPTAKWMETVLHEYGHAVYDRELDRALPFTLRTPAHLIITEGTAMLLGRLAHNAEWLDRMIGLPAHLKQLISAEMDETFRLRMLIFIRWAMVMICFEREFYRNPDQNLNKIWWDLVERFQFLTRPDGRDAPDWAAKIHIATAPVYYHNYLLGEIVASQLQHTIDRCVLGGAGVEKTGYVNQERVGEYLREKVFKPGRSVHWKELLVNATGEKLNPRCLADQLMD